MKAKRFVSLLLSTAMLLCLLSGTAQSAESQRTVRARLMVCDAIIGCEIAAPELAEDSRFRIATYGWYRDTVAEENQVAAGDVFASGDYILEVTVRLKDAMQYHVSETSYITTGGVYTEVSRVVDVDAAAITSVFRVTACSEADAQIILPTFCVGERRSDALATAAIAVQAHRPALTTLLLYQDADFVGLGVLTADGYLAYFGEDAELKEADTYTVLGSASVDGLHVPDAEIVIENPAACQSAAVMGGTELVGFRADYVCHKASEQPIDPPADDPDDPPEDPPADDPPADDPPADDPPADDPPEDLPADPPDVPSIVPQELPFRDVTKTDWFYDGVQYCYANDLMRGTARDCFSPQTVCSRAMIVTILYRMEGSPAVPYTAAFADVPDGTWYTRGVLWAQQTGIVNGYGNKSFGPNDPITREQLAAILMRYAKWRGENTKAQTPPSAYADAADVSPWAQTAMRWAVEKKLINGTLQGGQMLLQPQGEATRAECAVILMRDGTTPKE